MTVVRKNYELDRNSDNIKIHKFLDKNMKYNVFLKTKKQKTFLYQSCTSKIANLKE